MIAKAFVAKWRRGTYRSAGIQTSWLKIRNPEYSAMLGRRELFEQRRNRRHTHRRDYRKPELYLRGTAQMRSDGNTLQRSPYPALPLLRAPVCHACGTTEARRL